MQPVIQKILSDRTASWSQPQKEALVDLCLLGMYSDDLLSLAEQDFIDDRSEQLHWESGISFSGYLQRTIPKIRSIKNDPEKVQEMLQNINERLGSQECKEQSLNELQKLLETDELVKIEEEFISEVKKALGI